MNTPARLGVLGLGLVVVFGAALGIGHATGPVGPVGPAEGRVAEHDEGHGGGHDATAASALPGGLASSQDGYTLVLDRPTLPAGTREVSFTVEDAEGGAVTDYDLEHEKELHLIAVRRDATGFQHVHPERDDDGTWRVPLDLTPGAWRVFADFTPAGGEGLTLGADLLVPGRAHVAPAPPPRSTATVGDYEVRLDGDLEAGAHAVLALTVSRDGEPVTDLEPYLGAYGHLVALREGDLAYLHVHPEDGPAGPTVEFGTEVSSAGRYRLFLDFRHDGVVRTASFVVEVGHEHH